MSNGIFRPLLWPTVLTLVMLPILLGLGTWQVQRLHWKTDLIARMEARMAETPRPLPLRKDWASLDLDNLEYRPFTVTGHFLNDREMRYFTQDRDTSQPGFALITPLKLDSPGDEGAYVLVDRGFVPQALADPAKRPGSEPEGEVTLTGYLRRSEKRSAFSAADDPQRNIWMVRDIATMAEAAEVSPVAPFLIEADGKVPDGTWPKPGRTRIDLPNNHLDYALTWYGLAVVLLGIYIAFHVARGRVGRPKG
ncbi:SURF1 family protein [Parvibaculum sp. MBR-TMA-1.3b-4.2]